MRLNMILATIWLYLPFESSSCHAIFSLRVKLVAASKPIENVIIARTKDFIFLLRFDELPGVAKSCQEFFVPMLSVDTKVTGRKTQKSCTYLYIKIQEKFL